MNKNMKKIAMVLVATNVLASTIITGLPPVETHAAENKLTGSLLTASQGGILNPVLVGDKTITGHIPNGAGQSVTVSAGVYSYPIDDSRRDYKLLAVTVTADANGDYAATFPKTTNGGTNGFQLNSSWGYPSIITVESMGYKVETVVRENKDYSGYVNKFKLGDKIISGHVDNVSNRDITLSDVDSGYGGLGTQRAQGRIDANGDFSITLPAGVKYGDIRISENGGSPLLRSIPDSDNSNTYNATALDVSASSINTTRTSTGKLTTTVAPSFVNQAVTFASNNTSVINVDANGNWTALATGSATITVTSVSNPSLTKVIPVTVTASEVEIARTSVNNLFVNDNPGNHIKEATNQAAIDAAQAKVNAITNDPTAKTELQGYVTKAQNELNTNNVAKATADALFINNNPTNNIKPTTNQAAIDAAKTAAGKVTVPTKQTEINAEIAKAQTQLDANTDQTAKVAAAVTAVNDLFLDNNPANHIKALTDQAAINAAQAKVNLVTDPTKKAELQGQVNKAQTELNTNNAAKATADALFINNDPNNHIKATTDQAAIDAAKTAAGKVTVPTKQTEINAEIAKAQTELDATNAEKAREAAATVAINDLFINDNPANHIKPTTDQAKIDAAQAKVNTVTDLTKRAELQVLVDKAQNELNTKKVTDDATASVNALFADAPTNSVLKDSTTQAMIDAAKAKVDALPATTPEKAGLAADVAKANTLFNQITPTTIGGLTTDSTTVSGKGEANGTIVIKNGATTIASGKVGSDGNYSFTIAKQPALATVTATVTKASNGKTASASTVVKDEQIVQTTLDTLTIDSTTVTGKGEPNADIVIKNGATTIASGKVASDGNYMFFIPKQAAGSTITASVTKASNGKISTASQTIADTTIVQTTISSLTTDSTNVSGKGEPNADIAIKNGATIIASGKVGSDGNYSFTISKQAANSTVTATVTKASNGKTSSASSIVKDEQMVQTTLDAITEDSTAVSGEGEPNANIIIKNGATTIASGKVASDGSYMFYIPKQAGGSTITATVTKTSNGKTSSASQTIADTAIVQTTISSLTTDSTTVSGKGEPNGTLVIKNGSTTLSTGKIGSDGNYSVTIPKQPAGSTVTATVTKASNGKTSSASSVVKDDQITQTTLDAITVDSTSVSGKGEPNADIVIKNGATTIASGKVASDGNYLFFVTKQAAGSTITATVTKASNGKISSASQTIADTTMAQTTIGALNVNSTTVTGTAEANSAIVITKNGTIIASGTVGSNGQYQLTMAKQVAGSIIIATATKASNGKTSTASTTVAAVAADYKLTAKDYKIGDTSLTGTYGANIAKVRLFVNGVLIVQGATSNGNYTFANIASYITKPTDKVEIAGVDGGYVERARVAVKVTGDPVYDYSLTANDYTLGGATITGKYGKDVSKVRLWVNGTVVGQATTNADGTYSIGSVPSWVKLSSDKVEVVGVNAAYKEVARKTVVTKGGSILDTSLTPNTYTKGDANLTGTFGKDISKVRLFVNGALVKQATTNGSTFTVSDIASFITSKDDKVEVVGVNAQYNEVNRVTVPTAGFSSLDNALTAPPTYVLNSNTNNITGTYGSNVSKVRLLVNGVVVKQAVSSAGTYSLNGIADYIKQTTDLVEVVGVDAQYKEVNRKTISVENNPIVKDYTLTMDGAAYTIGAKTITGNYGKDIAFVRLAVDGVNVKTAVLNNGAYTINGVDGSVTDGTHLVELVAADAGYKEVKRITVTVK
ncbi:toxin Cry1Ac domain D-VI-related protein [Listeria rustica]|uniref:BIG2 domain-containing protein n=1 Tax=Listeria rustica TaxID=2713503 RepID=A0A7W1T7Z2_9LIST|nr:toxin Cry1Ac domain D-VI-related protein [Listeria rustica]MBA3927113.1 hypothetical protein [Listeria rustica]